MRFFLMMYLALGVVCSFWFLCVMLVMEDTPEGSSTDRAMTQGQRVLRLLRARVSTRARRDARRAPAAHRH